MSNISISRDGLETVLPPENPEIVNLWMLPCNWTTRTFDVKNLTKSLEGSLLQLRFGKQWVHVGEIL